MGILDTLMHSGNDLLVQLGGAAGAAKLLGFVENPDSSQQATDVLKQSADQAVESAAPAQREELALGLLGYLRNFHHAEADAATAHAHDLSEAQPVRDLLSSVVRVQPTFFQDVTRFLLRGTPSEAADDHGPQAWLLSLLKSPAVTDFFKSMLANVSARQLH